MLRHASITSLAVARLLAATLGIALFSPGLAAAQVISLSPDVTLDVLPGVVVADQEIAVDNLSGIVLKESLGGSVSARDGLEVIAFADEGSGRRLFVPSTTTAFLGVVAGPKNVVRFAGGSYEVVFDASQEGLASGTRIDAVTRAKNGNLNLSFDGFIDLGGIVVGDEDLVEFDGNTFTVVFDGSAEGVSETLDLDAASVGATGSLFLSFDGSGLIDGIAFDDEDVLEFDPDTQAWNPVLAFDASSDASGNSSGWRSADLEAVQVPEPRLLLNLAMGVLALASTLRHRRHSSGHARAALIHTDSGPIK